MALPDPDPAARDDRPVELEAVSGGLTTTPSLRRWADRVQGWLDEGRDVHVYFDNDAEGAAPRNALTLLELLS